MNFIQTNGILSFMIFTSILQLSKCQSPTVSFVDHESTVKEYVRELADLKDISSSSPYVKFRSTCHRFNACMLLRSEKLEMCRILQTIDRYSFVYKDHLPPLVICKKIGITIDESSLLENSKPIETYAFKCPLPSRGEKVAHENNGLTRIHTNIAYYISSGNLASWAIMYYSHASSKAKIKPDIAILDFPVEMLSKLHQKEYSPNPYFEPIYYDLSPLRKSDDTNTARMLWSPIEAEKRVETFVTTIKENKSPYNRFLITCHHTNVCNLTGKQRADSCKHSFDESKYTLLIGAGKTIDEGCERKMVFFEYLERPPTTMAVLNCPLRKDISKNEYYLSAAGSKDDFIAYMQIVPHPELLPDAVIHEISTIIKVPKIPERKDTSEENV